MTLHGTLKHMHKGSKGNNTNKTRSIGHEVTFDHENIDG